MSLLKRFFFILHFSQIYTNQQIIHLYRNLNLTQWHPVKHKLLRRRRRANHQQVLARSRQVSLVQLIKNFFSNKYSQISFFWNSKKI